LRERDERAARKAARKAEKARQKEAAMGQQTQPAAVQPRGAPPDTQHSQFYHDPHSHPSSSVPLFPGPDFTNAVHSSPAAHLFQSSNSTLPPHNVGGWNKNHYIGPQSSPTTSNDIPHWTRNQPHGPPSQSLPLSTGSNLPGNQNVMGNVIELLYFFCKTNIGIV
jgi:hypothetical protein